MAFNPNIPQASDDISVSQGNILSNFQFLGNTTTLEGIAITNGTSGNISTGGSYTLPNGLIVQYAKVTGSPSLMDNTLISFITTFPNACMSVVFSPFSGQADIVTGIATANFSTSQFQIRTTTSLASGAYYIAIGW